MKRNSNGGPDFGFVYALANHAMPNLFKIGFTEYSPHRRAAELAKTGVPIAFEVVGFFETERPKVIEARLHNGLDAYRVSPDREFFKLHRAHLLAVMRLHAREYGLSMFTGSALVPEVYVDLGSSVDLMRDLDCWECGGQPSAPLAGCIDRFYVNANLPTIRSLSLLAGGRA